MTLATASGGAGGETNVECAAPGFHVDGTAVTINHVSATLRDPSGAAVEDLAVQVCGLDQCFTGRTDASGKTNVVPQTSLKLPAFKYGDGFEFAELAVLLGDAANQELGELVALPLPAYSAGAVFPKRGSVENGDLTLQISDDTRIDHDVLTYAEETERVFRSVPIPLQQSKAALDPSFGFELAYGVAPLGTTFCPPARLSLKNSAGWPAESEVEVYIQGLDTSEKWAPYGSWVKVADARVSSDASSIETNSGGIPILSSIALRRK